MCSWQVRLSTWRRHWDWNWTGVTRWAARHRGVSHPERPGGVGGSKRDQRPHEKRRWMDTRQGHTEKYERGFPNMLINIHDIHMRVRRFVSQTCGVLILRGIGVESPMLRPKVWVLHACWTWINTRTILLNLIFSGSDSLMTPRVEYVHVLRLRDTHCDRISYFKQEIIFVESIWRVAIVIWKLYTMIS